MADELVTTPAEYAKQEPPARRPLVPPLPVWLVVTAALIASAAIMFLSSLDKAQANILVLIFMFIVAMTLAVWFSFFSGYPDWLRWSFVGLAASFIVVCCIFLRIEGTTGWMVPKFVWRFAPKPDELLDRTGIAGGADSPAAAIDVRSTTPNDFPRFLGPTASCAVEGPVLAWDWPSRPLRQLWKKKIGAGWSAFSVVNGFAFTMEQRGPLEMVTCYEADTGAIRWAQSIEARYETVMGGVGPRATPTVHDDMVYTLGATGRLHCLDAATGDVVWERSVPEDCGLSEKEDAEIVFYGRSNSPLIVDEMLVVPGGGPREGSCHSLVAYDRRSGEVLWKGGDQQVSYASPTLVTLVDTPQILIVNEKTVSGHDPATGAPFWDHEWLGTTHTTPNVSQAVAVGDDRVFISNGYDNGAALLQITYSGDVGWRVTELEHRETAMRTRFTNVVVYDGSVYGLSDGILECLELDTLNRRWKRGRYGHGQILRVGKALLVLTEYGDLVLIELSSERLIERERITAFEGKTWNNLCLFGNLLLVRNGEEAACFELPLAEAPPSSGPDS